MLSPVVTAVKLLLIVVFIHRCIIIYDRWSLGRTEKVQTSETFNNEVPYPAFTFRHLFHSDRINEKTNLMGSLLTSATVFSYDGKNYMNTDLIANAEDYFTEFMEPDSWLNQTQYTLTLNLANINFTTDFKPILQLEFHIPIEKNQPYFYLEMHPPHHVRYDKDLLFGLDRHPVALDKAKVGDSKSVEFSFFLTKMVLVDNSVFTCIKGKQEMDTCQRKFVEENLGCKLPGLRGKLEKFTDGDYCNWDQMNNISLVFDEDFKEDTCLPGCELYLPKISEESQTSDQTLNATDGLRLALTIKTDQLVIPVELLVMSYDSLDAMADIGGYLGLLLGASCLSIVKSVFERLGNFFEKQGQKYFTTTLKI